MGRTYRRRKRKPRNLVLTPQIGRLFAWILGMGFIPRCPLRLARTPATGRGLISLRKINKGDVIVDLPLSLLITPKLVRTKFGIENGNFSSEEVLTLFVISERFLQEKSEWAPYIESIPDDFGCLSSNRELDGLSGRLRQAVEEWNENARKSFSRLRKHFLERGVRLSFETFDWAWCAVNTRCIYVEGHGSTLAPFLDMLNHHWRAGIETCFVDNHFIIRSNDSYEAGEEVFISYGNHDNRTLFLNYGFVLDDNPNDCVTVEVNHLEKLKDSEKLSRFEEKIAFLLQHDKLTDQTGFTNNGATWNLEVALQLLQDDAEEHWKKIILTETTSDTSRLKKVLARRMLEDYSSKPAGDPMRQKLLEIEERIILCVINDDFGDGVT